jgi:L-fuconolactonase
MSGAGAGGSGAGAPGAGGSPSACIVDSHAHIWPRGLRHPAQVSPGPLWSEPSDLLAAAESAGIALSVLVPASIHPDNGAVLAAAAAAPARLRPFVTVDPADDGALESLEPMARAGALGVRVRPASVPGDGRLEPAALEALVDAADALGLVIQWTVPLGATASIERAAARRPSVRQVLDHLGLPPDAGHLADLARVRELAAVPNLHVKLSGMYHLSREGYPYRDTWAWAEGVVAAFGPERTMWASDWPLSCESVTLADQVALLDRLPFLDVDARSMVGGGSARRLFGLPEG